MIVRPIHTGTVAGQLVRFFTPPEPDGKGEFPWVSFVDLLVACTMPMTVREAYLNAVWTVPGGDVRALATPTGPVVVVSHFVAQGVLGAAAHVGHCGAMVEREYVEEAVAALGGLMDGAPVERILALLGEAARRGRNRERQDA